MALRTVPNRQIAEEAAAWAARIDCGPLEPADRKRLAEWLSTSPVHVDELLLSASFLAGCGALDRQPARSIEALLAGPAAEVIPLLRGGPETTALAGAADAEGSSSRSRSAGFRITSAVAASLLLLLVSTFVALQAGLDLIGPAETPVAARTAETSGRLLKTDFGEQRSITLEDGSVLYMNTESRLRVTLSEAERRIELLHGEALFEVAHDPDRPFRVYAGRTIAQAVGTKFNVKRTIQGVSVVVMEGKVLVGEEAEFAVQKAPDPSSRMGPAGAHDKVLVLAGDQADIAVSGERPTVSPADIAAATSWRLRKVSFRNKRLDAIAQEFNRYNRRRILVADQDIARLRFSGVFDADDPESFVAFLELTSGIHVDKSKPEQITLSSAAS